MFDLTKIHECHLEPFRLLSENKTIPQAFVQKMYDFYVELNLHPEEEWSNIGASIMEGLK